MQVGAYDGSGEGGSVGAGLPPLVGLQPGHKVELMSHAVKGADGRYLVFDPIPLSEFAWKRWPLAGRVAAIVLTNANHERAAGVWRLRLGCPVFGPAGVAWEMEGIQTAPAELPEAGAPCPCRVERPGRPPCAWIHPDWSCSAMR